MTSATTFCLPSLPVALILTFTTPTSGTREEILRKSKSCNIHFQFNKTVLFLQITKNCKLDSSSVYNLVLARPREPLMVTEKSARARMSALGQLSRCNSKPMEIYHVYLRDMVYISTK